MIKSFFIKFFHNKKGILSLKTIAYIMFAIGTILLIAWAIVIIKDRILG